MKENRRVNQMSKILIIGDTVAPYHPLSCVFPLNKLLAEEKLTFTNDYDYFTKLSDFDLLICFIDAWFETADAVSKAASIGALPHYNEAWAKAINDRQAAALLDYLNNGGKLLSIHSGLSLFKTPALKSLHGVEYLDHPPYDRLRINLKKGHPLTEGVDDFYINDEPYHFNVVDEIEIFASYEFDGTTIPAAWKKEYGKGKFIYLMPGHDEAVFQVTEYQKLIKKCVEYLVK
jgi:type 1 glutamine amidotransferase